MAKVPWFVPRKIAGCLLANRNVVLLELAQLRTRLVSEICSFLDQKQVRKLAVKDNKCH